MKNLLYFVLGLFVFFTGELAADNGKVTGKVTNFSTGTAISGATIQLQLLGITLASTTSDSNGNYSFNRDTGTYSLVCSQSGFQSVTTNNVVIQKNQTTTCNFQLVGLGSVSGTITNNVTGAVISGATVQMIQNSTVISSATTAANGTFSITGLVPGSYTMSVAASLFQTNTAAVTITSSNTVKNLTLQPNPGSISGTVSSSSSLLGLSGATLTFSSGGTQIASTTSGLLGAYTVSNLPPGTYTVSVSLAGYQTGTGTATVTSNNTTTFNINLSPLTGLLSGTVKDAVTNNTLSGATITVLQGSTIVTTATSGAQGTFSISNLSPGNYTVTTALSNYQTLSSSVTIISNQTTTLNPLLQALPGNVSGVITNSQTSLGLGGATVSVSSGATVVASTTANGSGNYSITGLAAGSYTLTASLNNFVAVSQSITISSNATLTQNLALTPQVGIVTGIVQDLNSLSLLGGATVTLLQGSTVVATTTTSLAGVYSFSVLPGSYTIRVSNTNYITATVAANVLSNATVIVNITLVASPGSVSGVVKDAISATALNGATVQVLQGSTIVGSTVTNSSGNYSITGISPGSYTLSTSLANYTTSTVPIVLLSNQTTTANINLQPQNGTASGQIKDAVTLSPIQGAAVSFYQGSTLVASTTTNATGNYSLSTLVPGSYTLQISGVNYQTASQAITIQSNTSTTTNLILQPIPGNVSGAVINAQTSLALSGVTVTLSQGSTVIATTVTNGLGNYSFTNVVPGSYTAAASLTNFTTSSQSITVNPNASIIQNFSLQPQSGTVSGQIISNLTSAPLNGVTVQALQGSTVIATTTTDVNGNYTLSLSPGSYTIKTNLTNYQSINQAATVQSNVTTTLNFSLVPVPGNISGTVTSLSTSLPLSGVTVTIKQGQTAIASVQTNLLGTYTVSNLTPGTYTVEFSLNNYQTVAQTKVVTSSTTTTADASLQLQTGNVAGVISNTLNLVPISNATVTALQGATIIATTTTGANGSYQLNSLPPGTYTISAVATNFQTTTQTLVVVAPNVTTTVNLNLQPVPGSVSGFITDNATTNPIQNASVSVTQNGVTIATTLTAANGSYTIGNLVPGNYTLVVSAANYQGATQGITINSNSTTTASASLQASPGAISGTVINSLTLSPISGALVQVLNGSVVLASTTTAANGTYTISGLAPAVSGVYTFRASATNFQTATSTAAVIANTTTPVSFSLSPQPGSITGAITNAQTGAFIAGANIQILQGITVVGSAITDANGLYTVSGLAPGSYVVSVSASNFQSTTQSVSVSANATTTVNLSLQPTPGSLSGLITDSIISIPLAGSTIGIWNQNVLVASTVTLLDGTYSISGLAPGNYTAIISLPSYQNASVSVTIFANQNTVLNQSLKPLPGTIIGTVLSGVTPISGASVTIAKGNTVIATLTTDGSGNFSSDGLAPGSYTITASASTYQSATSGAIVVANTSSIVNFHLVSQPGSISGTIIDAISLLPIPGSIVTVSSGNVNIASTITALDGSYTIAGLAPGLYIVAATSLNYQTITQGANVQALVTTNVNLSLQPQPGSLSGQIIDSVTLLGISGASVDVSKNNVIISSILTDSNGFYSATGLAPGAYTVSVHATNYQNSVKGALVISNTNSTLDVVLQSSPGTITGQVIDLSSNPLSGAFISLFSNNVLLLTQVSDAQGNFTIENLAPGNYSVVVQLANYQTSIQAIKVIANTIKTVTFTLIADPGTCHCTVLNALSNLPIPGVNVSILQGNTVVATNVTNITGEVSFPGLAPGSYQIRATIANYQSLVQGVIIQSNQITNVSLSLQPDPGALSGIITDLVTGNPISGATIDLIKGGATIASVISDNSGNYLVNSLAPGQYTIRVSANNYQSSLQVAIVVSDVTGVLNIGIQPTPGSINIALTDSITASAVVGAVVTIYNPLSNVPIATAITDATGNCLISGLAPGVYNTVITATNYQSLTLSATVAANVTTNLNLSLLADPGSILCLVLDSVSSLPISGCLVEALKGTTVIASGLTDGVGVCNLANLAPGTYIVRVSLTNYQIATQTVIVLPNLQTSLQVSLVSQPGSLTGTVLDVLSLLGLPQAQLSLFSGQTLIATTVSDPLGNYLFTGLAPGSYTLRVSLLNFETLTLTVTIVANQTTHRNCGLHSQPGNISGSVLDATTSMPIVGAEIVVLNGSTVVADVLTDSMGNYIVNGLSPNVNYTIRASATNYQTAIQGVTVQSNQTKTVNFNLNAQPGNIIGQVTDSATTIAIAGATVDLLQNSVTIASTQTDNSGNYQIPALAPGSYSLRVGANLYQTQLISVNVQANQTATVNVALQANPGSVQGTVVDSQTTNPLPNAQIQVFAGSNLVASFITDGNGNYLISGIAPGQYSITATLANYQSVVKTATIQSNATANVNFTLQPNPGSVIGNVIATSTGNPIASANVSIFQGSHIVSSVTTDNNGNYLLSNLAPGQYTIVVSANLFQNSSQGVTVVSNQTSSANFSLIDQPGTINGTVFGAAATVDLLQGQNLIVSTVTANDGTFSFPNLAPGSYTVRVQAQNFQTAIQGATVLANMITNVSVTLQPQAGTIVGQVIDAQTSNPLSDATVEVIQNSAIINSVQTDSSGNYAISNLAPGNYSVRATLHTYQIAVQGATVQSNVVTQANFSLNSLPGGISGQVTDAASGALLIDAEIDVFQGTILISSALTDSNGNYGIANLAPGTYTIRATLNNYETNLQSAIVTATNTTPVNFVLTQDPGFVQGQITDAATSQPITTASVVVNILQSNIIVGSALTDSNGNYFISGLPQGSYTLQIAANDYQTATQGITILANMVTTANVALQPQPGAITGTIIDQITTQPISGAVVDIMQGSTIFATLLTNSDGSYLINQLAPGNYIVRVKATNYQTNSQSANVQANSTTTVNIQLLAQPGTLTGTVKDPSSTPLSGAVVTIKNGNIVINTVITDAQGNFVIQGLAPGTYSVLASATNYQTSFGAVTIMANATSQISFSLIPQPGFANGQVIDSGTSQPVASATIDLLQNGIIVASLLTDSQGNYNLVGLAPGQYTIRATANNYRIVTVGITIISNQTVTLNFNLDSLPGSVNGLITDSLTSLPIANATIKIYQGINLITSSLSDANGVYNLQGLAQGNYNIVVNADNYQNYTQGVSVQANQVVTVNVSLQQDPATITGNIVDSTTLLPIANASVTIFKGSSQVGSSLTDQSGNFVISGLTPGTYTLIVFSTNHQSNTTTFTVIANQTLNVSIALTSDPGTLSGTVYETVTMNPIPGANVSILQGTTAITSLQTDNNGSWTVPNLAPGSYTIVITANAYQSTITGAQVQADVNTAVTTFLTFQPGSVSGQVTSNLVPLSGATIEVLQGVTVIGTALSDGIGNYTINSLAPGSYTIRASKTNFNIVVQGVAITANQQSSADFSLNPNPGSIAGNVTDIITSQTIAGVSIMVTKGGALVASTATDSNGHYRIDNLAPGSYTITTSSTLYQSISQGVSVSSNQTTSVDFALQNQPGSIAGQVIDQATGLTLSGVTITALNGTTVAGTVVTDSNGNFVLTGLAPGSYTVRTTLNNYQTVVQSALVTASATTTVNFMLNPNPGTATGQVTNINGDPITGGSVVLHVLQGNVIIASTLTDANGFYLINNLPAGSYNLSVMAAGYQSAISSIVIQSGQTSTLDFVLNLQPGSLTGTVTDTNGPIAGATVEIFFNTTGLASVLTDSSGFYQISNLAPGQYILQVSATNHQTLTQGATIVGNQTLNVDVNLSLNPGSIAGNLTDAISGLPLAGLLVNVSMNSNLITTAITDANGNYVITGLTPGIYTVSAIGSNYQTGTLSINVLAGLTSTANFSLQSQPGSITGTVLDTNSNPIANALIEAIQGNAILSTTSTDNLGHYVLTGLAPGSYVLRASANLFQVSLQGVTVAANTQITSNFILQSQPGSISGFIQDANTLAPIAGANVVILQGGVPVASALTQSDGSYSISGLPVGSYVIQASANNFQLNQQGILVTPNAALIVNLSLNESPGFIQGQVNDSATSLPISGATLTLYNGSLFIATVQTDMNGNYFLNNLAPGNYTISAAASNYQSVTQGVTVSSSATSTVNFSLASQPGSISGTVTDQFNVPVAGAIINVTRQQVLIGSVLTDSNGAYTLNGLAPENYIVSVNAAGFQFSSQGATVIANANTNISFALSAVTGNINVTVVDGLNTPIPGAIVQVVQNQALFSTSLTDVNGTTTFSQLAPGIYNVIVSAQGFQTSFQSVSVASAGVSSVSFSLASNPGSLSGVINDQSTSQPLSNATVQISRGTTVVATAISAVDGSFSINGIAPGSYTISVNIPNYQIYTAGLVIVSGQTTTTTIALMSNPGNVSGTVTDSVSGLGLPGTLVEVLQNSILIATHQTDSNGAYTISNLAPGNYLLRITNTNYQSSLVSFAIQANTTTTTNVALISQPGSIVGFVLDNNTQSPIVNASVNVLMGSFLIATATTDSAGKYVIGNLAPNTYQVNVQAMGYQIAVKAITVIANASVELDFGLTSLVGAVSGTVRDPSNLPIIGASISIYQGNTLISTTQTDANGNYTLSNLSPGTYTLVTTAINYQSNTQSVTVQANSTTHSNISLLADPSSITGQVTDATTLVPITGATVQVSFGQNIIATTLTDSQGQFLINNLSAQAYTVTISALNYQNVVQNVNLSINQIYALNVALQSFPGNVTGNVSDNLSQPIANATVYLLQGSTTIKSILTDSLGNYSLNGLATGNYTLQASASGFQFGTSSINIIPGATLISNFTLQPNPGSIQGTVTDGLNPLANAFVQVLNGNVIVASTLTNTNGVYTLPNLSPGNYTIQAMLSGYQTNTQGVQVNAGGTTVANFALQVGPSTIFGTVVSDVSLLPLPGIIINSHFNNILVASVLTNADGQYIIPGLVSGNYIVSASNQNFQTATLGIFLPPNTSQELDFILSANPGSVIGVVYDVNGSPIGGATITISQNNTVIATITSSANGTYTLPGLVAGTYTVTASAASYQPSTQGIMVIPNQAVALDFNLQSLPSSFSGTIVDDQANPIPGAQISIYQNGNLVAVTTTGTNGSFSLTGLGSGSYSVVITAPQFQTQTIGIVLNAGDQLNRTFVLSTLVGSIQGVVVDGLSNPLPNATVTISQSSIVISTVRTDNNGTFTVGNLPPGSYVVTTSLPNYQTGLVGAIVLPNSTTSVSVQLATDVGQIEGFITDLNLGTPIAAANITVFNQNSIVTSAVSDTNGHYVIGGLSPGNYVVTCQASGYQSSSQAAIVQVNATTTASFGLLSSPGAIQGSVQSGTSPIVSAFVSVSVLQGNTVISTTLTDNNGNYLITGLQPGNYVIKVNATGYQIGVQGVTVLANQTVTANFSLALNPGSIGGFVLDGVTSNPVVGASVQILQGNTLLNSGLTDANGNFVFGNLAPGSYIVTVSGANYQTFSTSVNVVSNQTTFSSISLQGNPGTISGVVIDSSSMQPVVGVVIDLLQGLTLVATTQTDANGQYILPQLPPGTYTIRATAPNYQVTSQGAIVSSGSTLTANLSLNILPSMLSGIVIDANTSLPIPGASVNLLQGNILITNALTDANGNFNLNGLGTGTYSIQVSSPNYQTNLIGETISVNQSINVLISMQPNPGSIQGTVTDNLHHPITGATVMVDILQGNILVAQTLTDINGFYTIPNLGEGSYVIKASATNFQTSTAGVIVRSGQVTIANFTLASDPGSITGLISDATTSLGIAGVQVMILNGPVNVGSVITDANGNYLISGLAPGNYTVSAWISLYQLGLASATVLANTTTTANIALQSNPGTIAGIITDDQGMLLSGAIIDVSANGVSIASALSSSSGAYQISGLPPGNYVVTVTGAGYQTFTIGVNVQSGQTSTQNIILNPNPGQIQGTIFDSVSGLPIPNAIVQLLQNNVTITTVLTDSLGDFLLQNLAPGAYMIRISATGYETTNLSVIVISNQTTEIDEDLSANPGSLQGIVTNASAQPLANINVQIYLNFLLVAQTLTDSSGFYNVPGLAAGNYTVIAGGQGFALRTTNAAVLNNQTTVLNIELDTSQGTVSGVITEAVTGNRIVGATVNIFSGNTLIAVALTDVNGQYSFSNIPVGNYLLRVSATNYQTLTDTISVVDQQNTVADEVLSPFPGSLTGVVSDFLNGPLSNVLVTVLSGETPVATTQTDISGHYLITGLSPGVYSVVFSLPNSETVKVNVTIKANETTIYNLELFPGALMGQVKDLLSGLPLPNVLVTLFQNGIAIATTHTNILGNYLFATLSPANYIVEFKLSTYQTLRVSVTINAEETTVLSVPLVQYPEEPGEVEQYRIKTNCTKQKEYSNQVKWTASSSEDIVAYNIYRDGVFLAQVPSTVLSYEDQNVPRNNRYMYQVAALNTVGLESQRVDAVKVKSRYCICH